MPAGVYMTAAVLLMSVAGGLVQERSRWLPIVLWAGIVGVAVALTGRASRLDLVPVLLFVVPPSVSLGMLLLLRRRVVASRIAGAFLAGLVAVLVAPVAAMLSTVLM